MSVSVQVKVPRKTMGRVQGAEDVNAKQPWMSCYLREAGVTRSYQSKVDNICSLYKIDECILRHISCYSNFVVARTTRSLYSHVSMEHVARNNTETEHSSPTRDPCVTWGTTLPPTLYPKALKACNLAFSLDDYDKIQSVVSIELLLSITSKETGKALEDIHSSVFQHLQVLLPTTISIRKEIDIDAWAISNVSYYVRESRKDCVANRPLFAPHDDNLLHTWIKDGLNYSQGNFVTADNYLLDERNRQQQLNTATTAVLRHAMFTLSIPLQILNLLWVLFHVLITGKVLPTARFSDMNTIWNNVMQLNNFDSKNKSFFC